MVLSFAACLRIWYWFLRAPTMVDLFLVSPTVVGRFLGSPMVVGLVVLHLAVGGLCLFEGWYCLPARSFPYA